MAGLDEPSVDRAATRSRTLKIPARQTLFRQGEPAAGLYVLCKGVVGLLARSRSGKTLLLGFRRAGDLLGEPTQSLHHYSAEILTDATVRLFPEAQLIQLGLEHPQVFLEIIRRLGETLSVSCGRLRDIGCERVRERLAHLLRDLAGEHGRASPSGLVIGLPLSQRNLAEMIGCSRQAVNRELSRLRRKEVIRQCNGRITITCQEKLGPPEG